MKALLQTSLGNENSQVQFHRQQSFTESVKPVEYTLYEFLFYKTTIFPHPSMVVIEYTYAKDTYEAPIGACKYSQCARAWGLTDDQFHSKLQFADWDIADVNLTGQTCGLVNS